ncbi:MAG: hypothetical protein ACWA42_05790 [Lutibacter sp.]
MNKTIYFLFLIILSFEGFAQENNTTKSEADEIIDNLFQEDQLVDDLITSLTKYQIIYFSATYNNKTYFTGRNIGINQFNVKSQISYINSNGLFLGIAGNYLSQFSPKWDVTVASLGYTKAFGKNKIFNASASYSKYFYSNSLSNIFSNDINVTLGVNTKNNWLGTQLSTDYLFGNDSSIQVVSKTYLKIPLYKAKDITIKLYPQISFIAGKQTIELARLVFYNGEPIIRYYVDNQFHLFNTQLTLPIQFNFNSFDLEMGYNFNFPNALQFERNIKNTSFFHITASYLINI